MEKIIIQSHVENHDNNESGEIDLYNFEDEQFSNSRYVLTSPRSLAACEKIGIKPNELLYKPLSTFHEELLAHGLPLRSIYNKYEQHESLRRDKLNECRALRDQIIRDTLHKLMPSPGSAAAAAVKAFSSSHAHASQSDEGYRSADRLLPSLERKDEPLSKASLERMRTAAAVLDSSTAPSCSGAQRSAIDGISPVGDNDSQRALLVTEDPECRPLLGHLSSVPQRASSKGLTAVNVQGQDRPVSRSSERQDESGSSSSSSKGQNQSRSNSAASGRQNLSRTQYVSSGRQELIPAFRTAKNSARTAEPHSVRRSTSFTRPLRSADIDRNSIEDLNNQLSRSLSLADLSTWRPPCDLQGTHLKSQELRRSLGHGAAQARVTPRDEKILEALHSKYQQEVEDELRRSHALLDWEEEKLSFERDRELAEIRRRRTLSAKIAEREKEQAELREQLRQEGEQRHAVMEKRVSESMERWQVSAARQQYLQEQRLLGKIRSDRERKTSQERALAAQKRQQELLLCQHEHNSNLEVLRASLKKSARLTSEQAVKQRDNALTAELHRQRQRQLESQSEAAKEQLIAMLEKKDAKVSLNQTLVNQSRSYNLHLNAKEQEHRFNKSRENLEKMDEDLKEWKAALKNRRRLLEAKAQLTSAHTIELKALQAQAEREKRERQQRKTYRRLQKEANQNCQHQKGAIAFKETRTRLVQYHKDKITQRVRSLAATSQRLRDELRKKRGRDNFDKKALETELQNRIGSGPRTGTRNKSTVLLA